MIPFPELSKPIPDVMPHFRKGGIHLVSLDITMGYYFLRGRSVGSVSVRPDKCLRADPCAPTLLPVFPTPSLVVL